MKKLLLLAMVVALNSSPLLFAQSVVGGSQPEISRVGVPHFHKKHHRHHWHHRRHWHRWHHRRHKIHVII